MEGGGGYRVRGVSMGALFLILFEEKASTKVNAGPHSSRNVPIGALMHPLIPGDVGEPSSRAGRAVVPRLHGPRHAREVAGPAVLAGER